MIATIIRVVAELYNMHPTWLVSDRRTHGVTEARHIAMYLARKMTDASFPVIASAFGGRHHSSVIAARDKIEREPVKYGDLLHEAETRVELSLQREIDDRAEFERWKRMTQRAEASN